MSSDAKESIVGAEKILPLLEPSLLNEGESGKTDAGESPDDKPASTNGKPVSSCTDPKTSQKTCTNSDTAQTTDESAGLKRKIEALQSTENGNGIAAFNGSDNHETKKRCVELDARIQNIRIEVTNPLGAKLKIEGIDCVKVNLVNEDLLKVAKRETLELKATNSKLTQELKTLKNMLATQHMEMKGLRVQCEMYKKDIELERIARQKTAVQIASDLQSLLKRNQMLIDGKLDAATVTAGPTHSIAAPTAAKLASTSMENVDDDNTNAVTRLLRIQQLAKKPEPVYSLISDHRPGTGRRQFIMEVECDGEKVRGTGLNKRSSKRDAAENFLAIMGYPKDQLSAGAGNRKTLKRKSKRRIAMDNLKFVEQQAADGSACETDELLLIKQDSADLNESAANDVDLAMG